MSDRHTITKCRIYDEKYRTWVNEPWTIYPGEPIMKQGYVIQWFSGLKDKNKNEVYEGDIVKINDHLLPEKVIFLFGSFGFHLNYKNSKDPRRKDNDSADFYSISEFDYSELEVIGNIFENSELLK